MSRQIKPLPPAPADHPATFDIADAAAVKAVYAGSATEHQQKRAMDWIIKQASLIGGQSYRAGDSHATAFVEGRRFVGAQIMGLITLNTEELKKRTTPNG
jgi:hypothetical protein